MQLDLALIAPTHWRVGGVWRVGILRPGVQFPGLCPRDAAPLQAICPPLVEWAAMQLVTASSDTRVEWADGLIMIVLSDSPIIVMGRCNL